MTRDTMTDRFRWLPRAAAAAGAVFFLAFGLWAMVDPESFFDQLATFDPYNQHFIQDIGAFQIGLGAVLLLALVRSDALTVTLLGTGAGMAAHVISHAVGTDLGGEPSTDIPIFAVVTVVLLAAGMVRWRQL